MSDSIQDKPGRLVVLVNKIKDKPWLKPWGIEATYKVKDWTGPEVKKLATTFDHGTVGTDIAGPFLLPGMKEKPFIYDKPCIHKVMIGANTYYVNEMFLESAYTFYNQEVEKSPEE